MKIENTDDQSQSHWILDEHYNKVASSTKINYPSVAHGVRFLRGYPVLKYKFI
jgi:hypothetical protein